VSLKDCKEALKLSITVGTIGGTILSSTIQHPFNLSYLLALLVFVFSSFITYLLISFGKKTLPLCLMLISQGCFSLLFFLPIIFIFFEMGFTNEYVLSFAFLMMTFVTLGLPVIFIKLLEK
jgi:hypothetical protein